ncbi:MAG: hypothetical protein WDW38_007253 [Sanguina aurantia]
MGMEFTQLVYNPEIGTPAAEIKNRAELMVETGLTNIAPGTPLLLAIMSKPAAAVARAPMSLLRPALPRLDIQLVTADAEVRESRPTPPSTAAAAAAPTSSAPPKPAVVTSPNPAARPLAAAAAAAATTPPPAARKSADGATSPKPTVKIPGTTAAPGVVSPKPVTPAAAAAAAKDAFLAAKSAAAGKLPGAAAAAAGATSPRSAVAATATAKPSAVAPVPLKATLSPTTSSSGIPAVTATIKAVAKPPVAAVSSAESPVSTLKPTVSKIAAVVGGAGAAKPPAVVPSVTPATPRTAVAGSADASTTNASALPKPPVTSSAASSAPAKPPVAVAMAVAQPAATVPVEAGEASRPTSVALNTAAPAAAAAATTLAAAAAVAAAAAATAAETAAKTAAGQATTTAAAEAKTAAAAAAAAPQASSPGESYEDDIEDDEGLGAAADNADEEEDFYVPSMGHRPLSAQVGTAAAGTAAPASIDPRLQIEHSELELSDSGSFQNMVGRLRPARAVLGSRSGGANDMSADIMAGDRSFGASHELGEYSHQAHATIRVASDCTGVVRTWQQHQPVPSSTGVRELNASHAPATAGASAGSSLAARRLPQPTLQRVAPAAGGALPPACARRRARGGPSAEGAGSLSASGLSTGPGSASLRPPGMGLSPLQPLGGSPMRLSALAPLGGMGKSLGPLGASREELLGTGPNALLAPPTRRSTDLEKEREELRRMGLISSNTTNITNNNSTTNTNTRAPQEPQHSHDTSDGGWSEVSNISSSAPQPQQPQPQQQQPRSQPSQGPGYGSHATPTKSQVGKPGEAAGRGDLGLGVEGAGGS